jgi:surfeit locus 1 family protein
MLAVIGFAILCGLGTWQLQRLGWKQDLIARVESRTELPPVPAPGPATWPDIDFGELDYRPVTVAGTFRHDLEVHAYAALADPNGPVGGQGFFVLTPLETEDGWTVIVNRGFVPEAGKEAATRAEGQIGGLVEVAGLLRPPQGRNAFTPADDRVANIWFTRDPAAIGEALGLGPNLAPYYIDAFFDPDLPGGLPQGGETELVFSNNHLQYAITWYGLALALAVIVVLRLRAGRDRRG